MRCSGAKVFFGTVGVGGVVSLPKCFVVSRCLSIHHLYSSLEVMVLKILTLFPI